MRTSRSGGSGPATGSHAMSAVAEIRLSFLPVGRDPRESLKFTLSYLYLGTAAALTLTFYQLRWEPLKYTPNYLHRGTTVGLTLTLYCLNRDCWEPLQRTLEYLRLGTTYASALTHWLQPGMPRGARSSGRLLPFHAEFDVPSTPMATAVATGRELTSVVNVLPRSGRIGPRARSSGTPLLPLQPVPKAAQSDRQRVPRAGSTGTTMLRALSTR